MANELELPPCGLYRTTLPHPTKADSVGAKRLVHFHNHSGANKPIVLMPKSNEHNVWTFHDKGFLVDDDAWCHTLEPLPAEGLYTTTAPLQLGENAVAEGQLVQLGYNGFGEPILFFPSKANAANAVTVRKAARAGPRRIRKPLVPARRPVPFPTAVFIRFRAPIPGTSARPLSPDAATG